LELGLPDMVTEEELLAASYWLLASS